MVKDIYRGEAPSHDRNNMHHSNNGQFPFLIFPNQEGDSHVLETNSQASNLVTYNKDSSEKNTESITKALCVNLEESNLWQVFSRNMNEMIVTRSGRRLFPVYKVRVDGLEPNEMYKFDLDFELVESFRWKYVGGEWLKSSRSDVLTMSGVYTHPDSPNYGKFWMHGVVSFSRAKITNREQTGCEAIFLHSMYKYNPRLIIKHIDRQTKTENTIGVFQFKETEFIAVTAYQNDQVTRLKVKNNPFAKAFHDQKKSQSYLNRTSNKRQDPRTFEQNGSRFSDYYALGKYFYDQASTGICQPTNFENMQKGMRNGSQLICMPPQFQNTMLQPAESAFNYIQPMGFNNSYTLFPANYNDMQLQRSVERPFYTQEMLCANTDTSRNNQIYFQPRIMNFSNEAEQKEEEMSTNPLSMLAIVATQERPEKVLKY